MKHESFELSPRHIRTLRKLVKIGGRDVFYDLGSGTGKVVIGLLIEGPIKKSVGIEVDREYHEFARASAINALPKRKLRKVDFWFGDFRQAALEGDGYFYDMSDATVVLNSLDEEEEDLDYYKTQFGNKKVKVVKKDLPVIGFESIADRSNADCWLFMTPYPFKPIKGVNMWAQSVFGTADATIEDVYDYYYTQLQQRVKNERDNVDSLLRLEQLVTMRF